MDHTCSASYTCVLYLFLAEMNRNKFLRMNLSVENIIKIASGDYSILNHICDCEYDVRM